MNIGEVISTLVLCASSLSDDNDFLLMTKSIYRIEVEDDCITVYSADKSVRDVRIYKDGTREVL